MKDKSIVALVAGLLCVVLTVFGMFKAIGGSALKMPATEMGLSLLDLVFDTEVDVDDLEEALEDGLDEFEDMTDEERDEWEDWNGIKHRKMKAFLKTPSIARFISIGEFEDMDNSISLFRMICIIGCICIIVYALLIVLFSLLGVFLKKKVFPILAIIFSIGFYLAFVGVIWFILFVALSIVQAVFFEKNKTQA